MAFQRPSGFCTSIDVIIYRLLKGRFQTGDFVGVKPNDIINAGKMSDKKHILRIKLDPGKISFVVHRVHGLPPSFVRNFPHPHLGPSARSRRSKPSHIAASSIRRLDHADKPPTARGISPKEIRGLTWAATHASREACDASEAACSAIVDWIIARQEAEARNDESGKGTE
ncbi:hypothetical protein [Beijerinckia indica]|uniref:hypothetical protein n=1 Tax=Beijerinckia indica TaxID=533 RepID=UPI0005A26583|nr:hypothetical protein [Beijerinckia indica]